VLPRGVYQGRVLRSVSLHCLPDQCEQSCSRRHDWHLVQVISVADETSQVSGVFLQATCL
jgi:hypothetical protein